MINITQNLLFDKKAMSAYAIAKRYLNYYILKHHYQYLEPDRITSNAYPTMFTPSNGATLFHDLIREDSLRSTCKFSTIQPCIRTADGIEKGGDGTHLSLYRMAVSHSVNSETRTESLMNWYSFLHKELKVDKKNLLVTVFGGGDFLGIEVPEDKEIVNFWQSIGIPRDKILMKEGKENFLNTEFEPFSGPTTELFFERKDKSIELGVHINFKYKKTHRCNGTVGLVEHTDRVFTSAFGVERLEQILNGHNVIYECNDIKPLVQFVERYFKKIHDFPPRDFAKAITKLAEQIRGVVLISSEDVKPGRKGRRYVFRKYLFDTFSQARLLGLCTMEFLEKLVDMSIEICRDRFPNTLLEKEKAIAIIRTAMQVYKTRVAEDC